MSLNCVEIDEIIKNIPKQGVIKSFLQPNKNGLIINYYNSNGSHQLLIDTTDKYNRICLIPTNERIKTENLKFSQILNSQLQGARIKDIYQYESQRIIVIILEYDGETKKIVARLWGNGGNIIFTDNDNYIVECLKRFSKREEWPNEEFILKPSDNNNKFVIRDIFDNKEVGENDINKKVFLYYKDISESEVFANKKNKNLLLIDKEIEKIKSSLDYITKNLNLTKDDQYLYYGELLKANIYKFKRGDGVAKVFDYEKNVEVTIEIDEKLTPSQNIELFFTKYKKNRDGKSKWEEQKIKNSEKLSDYEDIKDMLINIETLEELENFEKNFLSGKITKLLTKKERGETKSIGRVYNLSDGYLCYVSRSSKDADEMLNKVAKGNDYWFHIRDYAGSHVVVKDIKNKTITERAKNEAALLALYFSKAKKADEGDIYFTRVKYLHKAKGSGVVLPTQEKNIKVKYDKEILDKIIGK